MSDRSCDWYNSSSPFGRVLRVIQGYFQHSPERALSASVVLVYYWTAPAHLVALIVLASELSTNTCATSHIECIRTWYGAAIKRSPPLPFIIAEGVPVLSHIPPITN